MFPRNIAKHASDLLALCDDKKLTVTTAESCTGGLIAAALTDVPGASNVFARGFVTYSNDAKTDLLGVPGELFDRVGAVSEEVARAMAEGALERAGADLAISATGIAGPGGATDFKPVGLVFVAVARAGHDTLCARHEFAGDRTTVRLAAVEAALALAIAQCS